MDDETHILVAAAAEAAVTATTAAGALGEMVDELDELVAAAQVLGRPAKGPVARLVGATGRVRSASQRVDAGAARLRGLLDPTVEAAAAAESADDLALATAIRRFERAYDDTSRVWRQAMAGVEEAARWAAGLAAHHEPGDPSGIGPLAAGAARVFRDVVVEPGSPARLRLGPSQLAVYLAGVTSQAVIEGGGVLTVHLADTPLRWLRWSWEDGEGELVVSGDVTLGPAEQFGPDAVRLLAGIGLRRDADGGAWRGPADTGAAETGRHLAEVLRAVHGVGGRPLVTVEVRFVTPGTIGGPASDDPSVLVLDAPTVDGLAEAMVDRLASWVDVVGLPDLAFTLSPGPDGWPGRAGLRGEQGGELVTWIDSPALDPADRGRLAGLGWTEPDASLDPVVEHRWPSGTDTDTACWHLAVTLVAVFGLDPAQPLRGVVGPGAAESHR